MDKSIMNVYEMLRAMLFCPGESDVRGKSGPRIAALRAVVVRGPHTVAWAHAPTRQEHERYRNPHNSPYISHLNGEAYDREWPPLNWKTFKRLRNRNLIEETAEGWVVTTAGLTLWQKHNRRFLYFSIYTNRSKHSLISRHRKRRLGRARKEQGKATLSVEEYPPPSREEMRLLSNGQFTEAVATYRHRCQLGNKIYIESFLRGEIREQGKEGLGFRRRRGWGGRLKQHVVAFKAERQGRSSLN